MIYMKSLDFVFPPLWHGFADNFLVYLCSTFFSKASSCKGRRELSVFHKGQRFFFLSLFLTWFWAPVSSPVAKVQSDRPWGCWSHQQNRHAIHILHNYANEGHYFLNHSVPTTRGYYEVQVSSGLLRKYVHKAPIQ